MDRRELALSKKKKKKNNIFAFVRTQLTDSSWLHTFLSLGLPSLYLVGRGIIALPCKNVGPFSTEQKIEVLLFYS
jgi:hypothetical protein